MDEALARSYAAELNSAIGTPEFERVFSRLVEDKAVKQEEAVAIASAILDAKVAASTSRGTALGRIAKLHGSVATFKLKQKATGGRSAA